MTTFIVIIVAFLALMAIGFCSLAFYLVKRRGWKAGGNGDSSGGGFDSTIGSP